MTVIRLEQLGGTLRFDLTPGRRLVLGRGADCDLVVPNPSVSRRHAELEVVGDILQMHDLASANGTSVNGARQTEAALRPNDLVTFGVVGFRVVPPAPGAQLADEVPEGTAIRTLTALPATAGHATRDAVLGRLLDVAAGLSGEFALDELLGTIVNLAFDQVDADRVALLLTSPTGELLPGPSANRVGDRPLAVPRAIADRAISERMAVVTASALDDARFQSGSVAVQSVRGALCVPLLAGERVVGVLYADTITRTAPFDDDEARAMQAFAGLAAVAIARVRLAEEARRAREVRANFERFFAPEVAAKIAATPGHMALGGARLPVAVLFSDIRGFTALSEQLAPEEIAALLGDYFATMVEAVFEHGGTVDKFIGDAVMAVWGAPLPDPDAPDRALVAALAMRRELAAESRRRVKAGHPAIDAGFGLSFGEVFAGNVGSERRLEYTVVGDAVNLASRLCQMAGPGEILVTGELASGLTRAPVLEELPDIVVKGRLKPIRAYRVSS